jgi:hypothetical protein
MWDHVAVTQSEERDAAHVQLIAKLRRAGLSTNALRGPQQEAETQCQTGDPNAKKQRLMPCQAQDADTGPVALFGVRPAFEDQGHELGGTRADRRGVVVDALDRPLGIAPVCSRHMLGDRRVPAASAAAQVHSNPLALVRFLSRARIQRSTTSTATSTFASLLMLRAPDASSQPTARSCDAGAPRR